MSPCWTGPSVADVEAFFEAAGPDTRAVWLRLTRKGAEGRMRPSGMAEVRAAQADGRWANPGPDRARAGAPGTEGEGQAGQISRATRSASFET